MIKILSRNFFLAASFLFGASFLLAHPPFLHAQVYKNVEDLDVLNGYNVSKANGINNSGQIVGTLENGANRAGFVWDRSGMRTLDPLLGNTEAWDVNDKGQIAGTSNSKAVLWESSRADALDIGTLGGASSNATQINSRGQVVGTADRPTIDGNFVPSHGFLYTRNSMLNFGTLTDDVPEWDGGYSSTYGLNNLGQTVGTANTTDFSYHAFLRETDGTMKDLGTHPNVADTAGSAMVISDYGLIGGHGTDEDGNSHPLIWKNGDLAGTPVSMPAQYPYGEFYGVNRDGSMVGMMWDDRGQERAFVYDAKQGVIDLNSLLPGGSNWTLNYARDINDRGQIVGYGTHNGQGRAFLVNLDHGLLPTNFNGNPIRPGSLDEVQIKVDSDTLYKEVINVSDADLGGTLKVETVGNYEVGTTLPGFIQTSDGVRGGFTHLDTQITPTVVWKPQVNGNNVDLVASRDYANDVLKTHLDDTEKGIANALQKVLPDAKGDFKNVQRALDSLKSNARVKDAYRKFAPTEVDTAQINFSTLNSSLLSFVGHLDEARSRVLNVAAQDMSTPLTGIASSTLRPVASALAVSAPAPEKSEVLLDPALWIRGFGNYSDQDSYKGVSGYTSRMFGTTVGFEHEFTPTFKLGAGGGYAQTNVHAKRTSPAKTSINSVISSLYSSKKFGPSFYIDGIFSYGWQFYQSERHIDIEDLHRVADGNYRGSQIGGYLGAGYKILMKKIEVTPLVSLQYSHLKIDSYTEKNAGSLNLHVDRQSYDSVQSGVGFQIAREFRYLNHLWIPEFHFKWYYDMVGDAQQTTASFAETGLSFTTDGLEPQQSTYNLGTSLTFYLTKNISLSGSYNLELKDRFKSHSALFSIKDSWW